MTPLEKRLEEYLELRRSLGFKLEYAGQELRQFLCFIQRAKASHITTKLALEWATLSGRCRPVRWSERLGIVRRFARYLSAIDPRTEIPPDGLLKHRHHRKSPYFYIDHEVVKLIQSAQKMPSPKGIRAASYSTLFGLIGATGMRLGEAVGLDLKDVDLDQGLLKVRPAKFHKSRWVPLHSTTIAKLRQYLQLRNDIFPDSICPSFLLSEQDTRLTVWAVRRWFIILSRQIGLRHPDDHRGPRIHDLRHRFVIQTLCKWYRTGEDVEAHLPELATYVGHSHIKETYWYISATPELLLLATKRLEAKQGKAFS